MKHISLIDSHILVCDNMDQYVTLLVLLFPLLVLCSSVEYDGRTPALYCYQCNSEEDPSCEESGGEVVDCPRTGACAISIVSEPGKEDIFSRSCAPIRNTLKCNTVETESKTLRFCNCGEDLCNWDWESAGSTTHSGEGTTSRKELSCYSCHNASATPGACTPVSYTHLTLPTILLV